MGMCPNLFIKKLLVNALKNEKINGQFKIKSFGNWGRRIMNMFGQIWYVDSEKPQPASNSMQLYILINEEGLKFGFDYGDRINDDNSIVKSVIENDSLKFDIIDNLNKGVYNAYSIEPGSPVIPISYNLSKDISSNFDNS